MFEVPLDRLVPAYIKEFEPYIPSKPDPELMKLFGCSQIHRLNNNENPLGPPPAARDIIRHFSPPRGALYPSGDSYYLRQGLAAKFCLDPDQFIVGNGANEVIAFVIKAFCQEGDNIITADRTFAVYEWVARFSGFEARLVPLKDFGFDDEAMLGEIDERTKALFICNPNNPTGTYWTTDRLCRFLDRIDGRQIVVVDEAYFEYVERDDYPDGLKLIERYPNLIVFRTFSKMYGIAGLRIGYLAASRAVADVVRRTCVVYSVNAIAQEAALSALNDEEHVLRTRRLMVEARTYLRAEFARLGLQYQIGEGCYAMVRLPVNDTLAYRKLMARGIMIRSMTGFRFPNWIRVSMAARSVMEEFIAALEGILKK